MGWSFGMIIWDHWWICYSIPKPSKTIQNHPKSHPKSHQIIYENHQIIHVIFRIFHGKHIKHQMAGSRGRQPFGHVVSRCPAFRRWLDVSLTSWCLRPQLGFHPTVNACECQASYVTCWNMLEHREKTKNHMCNRQTISGIQKLDVVRGSTQCISSFMGRNCEIAQDLDASKKNTPKK